jgi:PIN domain nuclease of toxin-antitoxin system
MKYLIDTHVFIWFVENSPKLPQSIKDLIEAENSDILISIASLWEISIKNSTGKLPLNRKFEETINVLNENLIEILPILFAHTVEHNQLPFHHRDPFDRIIIAQAIVENINFISGDAAFDDYLTDKSIKRIW